MILVTGGTGLVGSYLLLQLARKGMQVKALIRESSSKHEVYNLFKLYEPNEYQELYDSVLWVNGDILDTSSLEEAFIGITQVYHVAGFVSFEEKQKKQLYKINIEGTKNIVNISVEKKIDKFCFVSSIATLDSQLGQSFITEQAEWNFKVNHSSYACSKYGAEMEVWRGSQEGLNVLVVHPGVILGSGNWKRSSGLLYDMAYATKAFYTSGTTAYIDAVDVAETCIQLMENKTTSNERYILIAENVSYESVMMLLRKQFNKAPAIKISDFWLKKIAILTRLLPINKKISKSAFEALTTKCQYSNDRIIKLLSYTFIPVEDSLKFHSKNYLQYKQLKND